ncbi:separase-like isoform X3 [Bidens hawaiensis]|uniref:separase-like isoform X3 n=1 Tax=Bidens hawaiensis TaxID=980011 RepID=UPI00404A287C
MADSGTVVTDTSLLTKLESSTDLSNIHQLYTTYLKPFSPVLKPPKPNNNKPDPTTLRSLAKKFLSFINKSLTLLPKRLNQTPKIDARYASELFDTYRLCLDCLDAVSSQLSCKPHSLQYQRVRLMVCYANWGRYDDAQVEGASVLEFIASLSSAGKGIGGRIVPEVRREIEDKEIALVVLEVVVSLVKCVANVQSKKEDDYYRVLTMVDEIQPWLRVIGAEGYDKLHRMLLSYMSKCALFMVGELATFDVKLICKFCVETFTEYKRSSMSDQIEKFAHRICSSVFTQLDDVILCSEKVLALVLDTMAKDCGVGKEKANVEFLELIVYFATKCRNATADFCVAIASHFKILANYFSQVNLPMIDLIMRLYAITFSTGDLNYYSRGGNSNRPKAENGISVSILLLDVDKQLQSLSTSITAHTGTYISFYFNALKYLCEPLSELIQSERKGILCGFDDMSDPIKLFNIEDVFQLFRLVFDDYCKFEKEKYVYEDNSRAVLAVATAAFILSFSTNQNFKECTSFLKELVSAKWVQANRLQSLYASLHNVGIVLHRANRLKEATEAFNLSCQAAWKCVILFCKMFVSSKDESSSDLSEDAITAFVTETCAKSAFSLVLLYQCGIGSEEISMILTDYFESWSTAQNWFDKIPIPVALVKQWVKILCKETKDPEDGRRVRTIYSLMPFSLKMSKETLGFLLEQELEAYREIQSLNPELSKIMQKTISNILLEDIYSTKDSFLHKSKILIAKGRQSRACGVESLKECIDFLSEAISTMSDIYDKNKEACGPVCNLLAEAYCLRALCTQEAEPNSKFFVEDIGKATKLWLSQEHSKSVERIDTVCNNTLILLYHVGDLLLLKGYMDLHSDIYELMIRFCTHKNISLKECLAMLWQTKSLSHALCTSHVNEAFILTFSKHCQLSKSVEFWKSCMEKSKPLEVGFQQCFSVISTLSSSSYNHDNATEYARLTVDIKKTAFDLSNRVPVSSKSLFLASNLYYDLSERMILKGLMIEALFYAKEAHRMRTKLFQKNFIYTIEQHNDIIGDNGEIIRERGYELKSFHIHSSVAIGAWSNDSSSDFEFILTSWNVLRCYLESTLQVGTIQEIIGNGSEAEALFLWGKNISLFQDLPIFLVNFSTALGKLHCKQKCWHLADKELESANHILVDSLCLISCINCKLIMEVTVGKQQGDLYRSRCSSTYDNKLDGLSKAEIFYRSAMEKLKLSHWKNCVSNPKETISSNTMLCDKVLIGGNNVNISSDCGNHEEQEVVQPKVTRRGKKTAITIPQEQRLTSRVTRSSKQKSENAQRELKVAQKSKGSHIVSCGCEVTCVCDEENCWHCVPFGVMKSSSLTSVAQMKWECARRRLLVKLLIGIGKCLWAQGETQRAHEVFLESLSVLVSRSSFHQSKFKFSFTFLGELVKSNVTGDVFAIEYAALFYNMCWFSLRSSYDDCTRNDSCDMSFMPISTIVSGLKLSFIACREVPELFQKVSRLLAVLYTLSSSNKTFSMLTPKNSLSESRWAAYFHQASLGAHVNYQLFSRLGKQKDQDTMDIDGSFPSSSTSLSLHRLAPESVSDLEEFILNFFQGLPLATIICISILGDDYTSWLSNLSPDRPTHSCIMLSRLNSDCAPIVIILPIVSVLAASPDDEDSSSDILLEKKSSDKPWHCPWGHTAVDEIAPLFRTILEESYTSSYGYTTLEDTNQNRFKWWNQRRKLDQWLSDLLRDIEDLWFGLWKHLLLGGLSNHKHIDFLLKKLKKDLKSKCKIDAHENIIKAIIKGGLRQEECLSELIMNKGCYVGGRECINDESISDLVLNTIHEIGEDYVDREPVILVLDFDIQVGNLVMFLAYYCLEYEHVFFLFGLQMLPWESLPVLRNQEVYRMPSVASILCTYNRCCQFEEKVGKDSSPFPMIDPLDAYYLLNPGGDLSNTEAAFGNWFKDQNLEGTAGTSPSVDELSTALKNHDLFIYLGHGSGVQYIPGGEIQKLERCAATLLMGCSSGSLSLNGSYTPKGAPLYYLFAGSPVIIANLWDVTDKDIDRFCKTVLDGWMKARSNTSVDCAQCTQLSDKFKDMSITDGGTKRGKKKPARSKSVEDCKVTVGCKHQPKIGSFMGQARGACTLPFLIGAAPVCYGVPTGIRKKDS